MKRPIKVGITGGIGSGKSFICDLFKQHFSIRVYNTDKEVKQDILRRQSVREQMIAEFGKDSYLSDGRWNREKFVKILFEDSEKREFVNRIVVSELGPAVVEWANEQTSKYVLIECAVLFENGLNKFVDLSLAVTTSIPLRIKRLEQRGVNLELFEKVRKIQYDEEFLVDRCDYVIFNEDDTEQLMDDVRFCHSTFVDHWVFKKQNW